MLGFIEVQIHFICVEFHMMVRKKKYKYPKRNMLKGSLAYGKWAMLWRFEIWKPFVRGGVALQNSVWRTKTIERECDLWTLTIIN